MSHRGTFRSRITFRKPVRVADDQGRYKKSGWETIATVWGAVKPMSQGRRIYLGQNGVEATHVIEADYHDIPEKAQAVEDDGRGGLNYYEVQTIDMKGNHRFMYLTVKQTPGVVEA